MRRLTPLLAILIAACAPQGTEIAANEKQKKPPKMQLEVTQAPQPLGAEQSGEVRVQVVPPDGYALNRYPGITLSIEDAAGLKLDAEEAFVGETKPLSDPDEFQFEKIDPLRLQVKAPQSVAADASSSGAERKMTGTLKFFYCRKADGYCAPGQQKVSVPVRLR